MKTHHVRNLSASNKKASYSTNSSPNNATNLKKDRHDSFQIPDIKLNLNIVNRTPSKANETKTGPGNLFINNLNLPLKSGMSSGTPKQGLFIGKISNTQRRDDRKQFSHGGHSADDSYDRGIETSGRVVEKSQRENTSRITFSRSKGTPVMASKGRTELPQSDFLIKLAKNHSENKKYASSPRGNVGINPSSQKQPQPQQSQTHSKNKKSFDISSLYPQKGPNFSDLHTKSTPMANSSGYDPESPNKSKMPFNEALMYNFTSNQQPKVPTPSKGQTNIFKLENSLLFKHKRAPSHEPTAAKNENVSLKPKMPELDKMRKSSDYGDARLLGFHSSDHSNKRHAPFRFAVRTRAGATTTGAKKTNQDSYIALTNFGKNPNKYFFGICDGHGTNGHLVSSFVKETLPSYLLVDTLIDSNPEITLTNAYELCHQKLLHTDFDTKFSGTTCVTLLINGNKIISSNAGDSRAVMAFHENGEWDCIPLSNDHKPNLLTEAQRILMAGGRIEAFRDGEGNFVGPSRVWLQNQNIPGLAMSRSIGDVIASTVGVTCRPEIKEFKITPEDKFIILASDGVWEFIESTEAVKMVVPFYEQNNLDGACDYLMAAALKKWREEEEHVVDDITLIIIFL